MTALKEIFLFMLKRKKLWLLPILIVMFFVFGLIILSEGSVVTPFIYALF
jgi:hypothetical protein